MRHVVKTTLIIFYLSVFYSYPAFARDERCSQLEQLAIQYANVSLTISQKAFKRQAIAWYSSNCKKQSKG